MTHFFVLLITGGLQQGAFEGVGQRLGYPHAEDVHHNVPAGQLAGGAVQSYRT